MRRLLTIRTEFAAYPRGNPWHNCASAPPGRLQRTPDLTGSALRRTKRCRFEEVRSGLHRHIAAVTFARLLDQGHSLGQLTRQTCTICIECERLSPFAGMLVATSVIVNTTRRVRGRIRQEL
jgi:hypothetical protein